mgnify:CR=1 FL=1
MTSLIYAMVRLYNEREERLNGVVFGDIKSLLLRNIKRLFLMGIACSFLFIFAVIFIVLLAVLTPFTLILTIPLLFAFMVPLALMAPIYLFEDISLGEAFNGGFQENFPVGICYLGRRLSNFNCDGDYCQCVTRNRFYTLVCDLYCKNDLYDE